MIVKLYKKTTDQWSDVKLYANCKHYIGSYYTRSGRRYTGLNEIDRERFEKELGKDLRPDSEFWDEFNIPFKSSDDCLTFNTSNVLDEFKVKFLEGNKRVANGYGDRKAGADFVLVKEEEVAEEINRKAKVKIEAMKEYDKLTPNQMRQALRLYGHKSDNVSSEVVQSTLYTLIEEEPKKFKEMWIDNPFRETQFLIEEAVANNVLRRNKTIYKYGSDIIGNSIEEAIEYLRNPANANLRLTIKSNLEGKKFVEQPTEERETVSEFTKLKKEIEEEEKEVVIEEEVKEEIKPKKVSKK